MNASDSLDNQAGQIWADTSAWLSSHSLQILLGVGAGAVIVALLLGVKWVGVRICGTDPTHLHWRTVVGRVLVRTRLWFMVAVAARLVMGYSQVARNGGDDASRSSSPSPPRSRSRSGCASSCSA